MNTTELIAQESQILPENLRAEVLDFIGCLKKRHAIDTEEADIETKVKELDAFFKPYRHDLTNFKFDREEANER